MTIGQTMAKRNNETIMLDVPPQIKGGRTLVPLRFVSEALGSEVEWDGATRAIRIKSSAVVVKPVVPKIEKPEQLVKGAATEAARRANFEYVANLTETSTTRVVMPIEAKDLINNLVTNTGIVRQHKDIYYITGLVAELRYVPGSPLEGWGRFAVTVNGELAYMSAGVFLDENGNELLGGSTLGHEVFSLQGDIAKMVPGVTGIAILSPSNLTVDMYGLTTTENRVVMKFVIK